MKKVLTHPNNLNAITIEQIFFYLYFGILFGMKMLGISDGMNAYAPLLMLGLGLFVIHIALSSHTLLEIVQIVLLLIISMTIYYLTGEKGFLLCTTLLVGFKSVQLSRVWKFAAILGSTAMLLTIVGSVFAFLPDRIQGGTRPVFGYVVMHCLGYAYKNTAMVTFTILAMVFLLVCGESNDKKIIISTSLLALFGALYIFFYSISRTGLLILLFLICFNYYFKFISKYKWYDALFTALMLPACLFFQTILPLIVNQLPDDTSNTMLHRLQLANYYIKNNPLTLMGGTFKNPADNPFDTDMSFTYLLVHQGLLPFIFMIILYALYLRWAFVNQKGTELAVTLCILFYSNMEPFLFNLSYKNISLILIGQYLYIKEPQLLEYLPAVFSRSFSFGSLGKKKLLLPSISFKENQPTQRMKKATLSFIPVVLIALLLSAISYTYISSPTKIYVSERSPIELRQSEETYHFDDHSELFGYANHSLLLDYEDHNSIMYLADPAITTLELIRKTASIFIFSSLFIYLLIRGARSIF